MPEDVTVQPDGKPGKAVATDALVCMVVGVQPPALGVLVAVVSRWVPSNGIGALFDVDVTAGGAAATGAAPFPLEWIVPPLDLIDCQVPSVPEYEYCVPVE